MNTKLLFRICTGLVLLLLCIAVIQNLKTMSNDDQLVENETLSDTFLNPEGNLIHRVKEVDQLGGNNKDILNVTNYGEDVHVLHLADEACIDSVGGFLDLCFKKQVESLSGGKLVIELHMESEYGSEREVLEEMLSYPITKECNMDLARISAYSMVPYGARKHLLFAMPYTFFNHQHAYRTMLSEEVKSWLNEPVEAGYNVKGLFYSFDGFREVFSSVPIYEVKGLYGKNIRLPKNEILKAWAKVIGSNEVVDEYDSGINGYFNGSTELVEMSLSSYDVNNLYDYGKFCLVDHHMLEATELVMANHVYEELSDEEKLWIKEACDYTETMALSYAWDYDEARMREVLGDHGVVFNLTEYFYKNLHKDLMVRYEEAMEIEDSEARKAALEYLPEDIIDLMDLINTYTNGYEEEYKSILKLAPEVTIDRYE